MTLHARSLLAVLLLVASGDALAQVRPGIFGYQVSGVNGTGGDFCHTFDCTPRTLDATAGETLTLRVNAPLQALFAIGASFSATSCVTLPFAANMLVIDAPVVTLTVGVVSQGSPILSCWGGTQPTPLALPPGLPVGLSFATQALAVMPILGGTGPAFSVAVVTTIR